MDHLCYFFFVLLYFHARLFVDALVSQIYPSELQLNKANASDTEAAFLDCICQFLMILFLPKFMINVTTLILKLSISHF